MEIWTDGTLIVQACEETTTVRVLRDFAVVGEARNVDHLGWKTPLAVDVDADRIWAGNRLQEFRLSDVSPVATHEDKVWRVAALGGGRLAAILAPRGGACRLAVGRPGRWERELVLNEAVLAGLGKAVPGLAMTDERPKSRDIDGDPVLTATQHGLVVADGKRGVVAHFTAELDLLGLWHSGAVDETDLIGYATARGVLVTAMWAARDARVGWLTPDGPEHLRDSYGAYALPAGDSRFWLASRFDLELVDHDGRTLASGPRPHGLIHAAHAAGTWCVLGHRASVFIAFAGDDAIATQSIAVGGIVDMYAIFAPGLGDEESVEFARHSLQYSVGQHPGANNREHVVVQAVRPGAEDELRRAMLAAGAIHVNTVGAVEGHFRLCCSD